MDQHFCRIFPARSKHIVAFLCYAICCLQAVIAADISISSSDRAGQLTLSNAFPAGVVTIETAGTLTGIATGQWSIGRSYFTSNSTGTVTVPLSSSNTFVRIASVDISTNAPRHYTNLLESYGILETVAGRGQFSGDHISYWSNSLEGAFATNMNLSRPHNSFGDAAGNIYIVDQGSSAIEKVTPDGRIHTYAGTHIAGNNGDGPAPATNLQLRFPNGGYLRSDGVFYVLDTENSKLRRIDTNGIMSTVFSHPNPNYMGDGRALWMKADESLVYFGSGPGVDLNVTTLNKWTPAGGFTVIASNFLDIGNIVGDERTGDLYIADRNAFRVYRLNTNGVLTTIAGNGTATGSGGEGSYATNTSLNLPRGLCFLPNGGFFITEHDPGNRVWYVDPAGIIHRWINGSSSANGFGLGDGQWFYANPSMAKMSRVRAINADPNGNLIITESNNGYVRRIRFQRLTP
jgi:sugar lactone lactonase YvrE